MHRWHISLAFSIVMALGMCLVQLAKKFPSAGGYYTYVSRTLGPRLGFLTGWMFTFYSPIVAGPLFAYFGFILENELKSNYGWTWFHWWMLVIVGIPLIALVGYLGIALSVRAIVVVGAVEFLIVLALGLWGLFDPGPGGFTFQSFNYGYNPGDIATASGFTLAIVFTVQGLTGWEAAVPLAEETENPRKNVPRATMALDRHHRHHAGDRDLGAGHRLGRQQHHRPARLERAAGAGDCPPRVGKPLVARPACDVHLDRRRKPRVSERGDPHVVRHGP